MAKVKWGLIVLSIILGLTLGAILQEQVCSTAEQDLGTGTSVMKATCAILSIPTGIILLVLLLAGLIGYLIWDHYN